MTSSSARFEDLQRKFDENPRRYFAPLANELRRTGDARRAVELCRTFLEQLPEHLSGHVVLAQALADLGETGEALRAFETVLDQDPQNVVALRALGDLAAARGAVVEARGWYARLLEVDPRDEDATARLASVGTSPEDAGPPTLPSTAGWSFAPSASDGLLDEAPVERGAERAYQDHESGEDYTAEFFASVRDEPPQREEEHVDLDAALARPLGAGRDLQPDEIDRLLADLPALGEPLPSRVNVEDALTPWQSVPPAAPSTAAEAAPAPEPPAAGAPPAPLVADDADDRAAAFGSSAPVEEPPVPFVTETMATLYLQQGHRAQALQLYEQLVAQHPDDHGLRARLEELRAAPDAERTTGATPTVPADEGRGGARREGDAARGEGAVAGAPMAPVAGAVTVATWLRALLDGDRQIAVAPPPADAAPADAAGPETLHDDLPAWEGHAVPEEQGERWIPAADAAAWSGEAPDVALSTFEPLDLEPASAPGETEVAASEATAAEAVDERADEQGGAWAGQSDEAATGEEPAWAGAVEVAPPADEAPVEAAGALEPLGDFEMVDDFEAVYESSTEPELLEAMPPSEGGIAPAAEPDVVDRAEDAADDVMFEADHPRPDASAAHEVRTGDVEGAAGSDDPFAWGGPVDAAGTAHELDEAGVDGAIWTAPVADVHPAPAHGELRDVAGEFTLDQLFERPVSHADEVAAGALAAASLSLQNDPATDEQLREASAEDPGSVENVLRAGATPPARTNAGFSFDQFFRVDAGAPGAAGPRDAEGPRGGASRPGEPPAPGGTDAAAGDDLEEFHAWLAGLSKS